MSIQADEKECAHFTCGCPAREGNNFCSEQCENAGSETDCGCGHPDCRARA